MIIPIIFGLCGALILISLGYWQVQRLNWKQNILTEINLSLNSEPVELREELLKKSNQYLPIKVSGEVSGQEVHVLMSLKKRGAGYRLISAFDIGKRKVLLDQGFISLEEKDTPRVTKNIDLIGNLYWPNEIDRFTPTPDRNKNIWFARDINEIAAELKTEPFLIVARNISPEDPNVMMLPVSVDRIPNNHLQYAITWFLLAFVWLGMTLYFLWRMKPIKHC